MLDLEALMTQAEGLPPLPSSAAKIASLVAGSEPDLLAVAAVAERDPALTAALLRKANSAAVAGPRSIAVVKDAVLRLGAASVLQTVTAATTRTLLDRALPEYGLRAGQLWEHCRVASLATDLIARSTTRRVPQEASSVALLHDIGKLVLARFLSPPLRELLDRAYEDLRSYRLAEREVLGVCQSELGGLLAERWRLPSSIVLGITYYHAPQEYEAQIACEEPILTTCHVVHFANFLAKCTSVDPEGSDSQIPVERTATVSAFSKELLISMEYLHIDPLAFSTLLSKLQSAVSERAAS
jgi:HD-like signal output (HDOD) protein